MELLRALGGRYRTVALLLAGVLALAGGGYAAAEVTAPRLTTTGPTAVTGTDATAVFEIGGQTIRQVRYADGGTLGYRFRLHNPGSAGVRVERISPGQPEQRLLHDPRLTTTKGSRRVVVPAGRSTTVLLRLRMRGCESLSARSGSFLGHLALHVVRAGVLHDRVTVRLPERLHTGSPREAFCPNATASSRPPG